MKFVIEIILHNKLIRICLVFLILYLGVLSNKEHPDSLGNRLSKEKLSKDIKKAKDKSLFIVEKLRESQSISNVRTNSQFDSQLEEKSETKENVEIENDKNKEYNNNLMKNDELEEKF